MNLKNIIVPLCSILILAAAGLGISIIYSDYLYSPTGTLNTFQVMSSQEPGYYDPAGSEADSQLLTSIEDWALQEHATVLFKDGFSAGCGFCGFSDWAERELKITDYGHNERGVYVADDPAFQQAYVSGDVLFPQSAALKIAGTYDTSDLPQILTGADFLYPLSISSGAGGMYFTDAEDTESLAELFNASGYRIVAVSHPNNVTFGRLIRLLFSDSFLSVAVLFAMAGLIFCYIYSLLIFYRDNVRSLWIRHLFGLSRKRILLQILLLVTVTVSAASLLFAILLTNGLTYMSPDDLCSIFKAALMLFITLAVFSNITGYCLLSHRFRTGGA